MIEDIKKFLETQNLHWTGDISKSTYQDFSPAKEKDFEELDIIDFLLKFGSQGYMAISIELDLKRFNILGETFDCGFDKYAGKNIANKELCVARDLSSDWVDFQLKNNTLLYASALRVACQKERNIIKMQYKSKEEDIDRQMKELYIKKVTLNNEKQQKIEAIEDLEKRAEDAWNTL